jgi:hypothetical protein
MAFYRRADDGIRTHTSLSRERILSPLRLPFRHIGVRANLTHGPGQTKRFSLYDQLRQRSRNFLTVGN